MFKPSDRLLGAVEAAHSGALAHPPRVPADDVESLPYLARKGLVPHREKPRSADARAAGLVKEAADASIGAGCHVPDQRELDSRTVWVAVVQRHLCDGALKALLSGVRTAMPIELRDRRCA